MKLEELDNYMKAIDSNFTSHIENGTIEMNNEYYNLLEEKMARLINENQELKKQVEEYKDKINWYENFEVNKTIDKLRLKHNTQQKEFIKYLEDEIKLYENDIQNFKKDYKVYFSLINDLRVSKAKIEEILQKYKEIIGVSDEKEN